MNLSLHTQVFSVQQDPMKGNHLYVISIWVSTGVNLFSRGGWKYSAVFKLGDEGMQASATVSTSQVYWYIPLELRDALVAESCTWKALRKVP